MVRKEIKILKLKNMKKLSKKRNLD